MSDERGQVLSERRQVLLKKGQVRSEKRQVRYEEVRYEVRYEKIWIGLLSLIVACLVTGMIMERMDVQAREETQQHLAEQVIRLHILANSDSDQDQNLKMEVKEQIVDYLEEHMPKADSAEETKGWIREHITEIQQFCQDVVAEEGYSYSVNAAVTTCYFPDKTYGDLCFPAGNYEALRVEIGSAKGHNWWCCLYPQLCFEDAVNGVVTEDGKEKLRQVLTEEEYNMVTDAGTKKAVKWYFLDRLTTESDEDSR